MYTGQSGATIEKLKQVITAWACCNDVLTEVLYYCVDYCIDTKIHRFLLEQGARITEKALIGAVDQMCKDDIALFVEFGAKIDAYLINWERLLRKEELELIQFYLDQGFSPDSLHEDDLYWFEERAKKRLATIALIGTAKKRAKTDE
ncbi:MAG: hypothetical protein ACMG6E_02730 [Candidatus Roizmanbacteria bacterium]